MHERTNRYATIRRPLGDPISSHRMQPDVAGVSVICCLLGLIAFVTFKVLNITYSTASSSLPAPKVTSFQEPRHMKHAAPCQRYAYLTGPREGFGHMMSQLALTYIYALEKNATMVIDKSKFMVPGKHGVYRWINEVLDLHDIADIHSLNAQQLRLTSYNEQLWHQHSHHAACNVFYTSCDTCCNFFNRETLFGNVASYCYYNKPSLFQLAKPFFLPRYRGTAPSRIPQLLGVRAAGRIDVVWHVRVGDITLSQNTEASVVANVMQQLQESFPPLTNFSLIIISEQSISDIPVYKNSFEPFEPVLWLSELDARQALEHMVWCFYFFLYQIFYSCSVFFIYGITK